MKKSRGESKDRLEEIRTRMGKHEGILLRNPSGSPTRFSVLVYETLVDYKYLQERLRVVGDALSEAQRERDEAIQEVSKLRAILAEATKKL